MIDSYLLSASYNRIQCDSNAVSCGTNTEKIFFSFRSTLGNGCIKVIDGLKKLLLHLRAPRLY